MNSKDIQDLYTELNKNNTIFCTKNELEIFLLNGYLLKADDKYYDRIGNTIKINIFNKENMKMNLNFNNLLKIAKESCYKKVFYMSEDSYNKYKQNGLIIEKNKLEFYRLFDNDLWLVQKF